MDGRGRMKLPRERDMTTNVGERSKKLTNALHSLGEGKTLGGHRLDFARIAAKTHSAALKFARKVAFGQKKTAYKMRKRRFKG